jgi:hypothetical protein
MQHVLESEDLASVCEKWRDMWVGGRLGFLAGKIEVALQW